MTLQMLQSGIAAVQAGNRAEGARLLKIALKSGELSGPLSAIAYQWLAETADDPQQKIAYYNSAVTADPNNADASQRLTALLGSQLPPASTPTTPAPPMTMPESPRATAQVPRVPTIADHLVNVIGGPNGPGTAFFVRQDGLLATTRYTIGGLERITIEVSTGRQIPGIVVRAFPDMDLALIRIDEHTGDLMPITPYPRVPDEATLTALAAGGRQVRGKHRPTKRVMAPHWIPTDIVKLADSGGNPLLDERNYLVGMMTKNSSRASAYMFGLHITAIRRAADIYTQEMQGGERRNYCPSCGSESRAIANGYFFCEVCGTVAPQASQLNRYPQADPYFEPSRIRCSICGAQVGFYGGRCLRCGQTPTAQVMT
jgi:hypothetical protein